MKDKRVKGCPNPACGKSKAKVKFGAEDKFCTECGDSLVFVCGKCFTKIEDKDASHKLCKICEENKEAQKEKIKGGVKKAAVGVLGVVGFAMKLIKR